ncbi:hypothetical protein GCM10028796_57250 [Ramlibacter monticola]|uniref:Fimbrial protein n=1 Tax=Ramlibacter monticola TaxID=1926872 RepID=A0A937CSW0_9BURK|nr:fimbrial protein [Ramlibacter monticola]MBL0391890.1 fimbrial protein [Ramlibacter monticola]
MKHILLKIALAALLPLFLLHQEAWASCPKDKERTIRITLPNKVYVFSNAAVGTVVWTSTGSGKALPINVECQGQTYGVHRLGNHQNEVTGMPGVYRTDVPYLGIKVVETTSYTTVGDAVTRWYTPAANLKGLWARPSYQVSLVVIGKVTENRSLSMQNPIARDYASDSPTSLVNEVLRYQLEVSSTNIELQEAGASACTAANVSANLGTHQASAFTGIGSTTAATSFNIRLTNCPTTGKSSVMYQVDPITAVADPDQSVVTLNPASTATGVGVQLLDGSGTPFPLGTPTSPGATSASYTIPLKARFYQTGTAVKGGAANAAMTFTITYQ